MTIVVDAEHRYDRQERITWWEQARLAAARVLVVGAGAIGNEVVKNLVLMGVGTIVVVDFDTVDASNLARCVFFRAGDDGRPKVDALAERARQLNPDVDVIGLDADIRAVGTGVALRHDVLVGALDNREARLYLNRLAWRVGRPWIDGAIEGLFGVARVFSPPDGCYECTLTEADFAALAHRQSCRLLSQPEMAAGRTPTTAPAASIVGGLQAQEVVKLLHRGRPGVNHLDGAVIVDGANNDAYPIRYPLDEECLAHHTFGDPSRLPGAYDQTFGAIAARIGVGEAVFELGDDHVVTWRCPDCATDEHAGRPALLVKPGEADCPRCGTPRQFDVLSSVRTPSAAESLTPRLLGVRPDEIMAVRTADGYRYAWFDDGDALPIVAGRP